ncbi:MAG: DUF7159 family protein, partial [Mycobacterium sp.]
PAPRAPAPAGEPVANPGTADEQQGGDAQRPDANGRQPYLTRMLQHIPSDAADQGPGDPAQP